MELTVGICVYNAAAWIEETLASVMAQTRQDFHLLIVDDCSTDDSVAAIERFFREHPRQYELVRLPENRGIAYGRSYVERNAPTRYMLMVDADDILLPEAIEILWAKMMSAPDKYMAVGCYLDYIDERGRKIGGGLYLGETSFEGFVDKASKSKLIFMQPTAIVDREMSLSVGGYDIDGFPPGKPRWADYCEDLDLWTRMSDLYVKGKAIIVVPKVLAFYRKRNGGLSSSTERMIIKMRYVKANLLRRRAGERELTFVEFYDGLTKEQLRDYHREAVAADSLRNGVFYLKRGRVFTATWLVLRSIVARPSYLFSKLRHNLFRR